MLFPADAFTADTAEWATIQWLGFNLWRFVDYGDGWWITFQQHFSQGAGETVQGGSGPSIIPQLRCLG
jgi:hypothetical protein